MIHVIKCNLFLSHFQAAEMKCKKTRHKSSVFRIKEKKIYWCMADAGKGIPGQPEKMLIC